MYPEERALVQKAIAKRQNEFGAGRACARRCLERLGIHGCVLTRTPDGGIAWPAGIIGTISHSHTWCGAAIARQSDAAGLGFDIETVTRMTRGIARKVLTTEEFDWISDQHEQEAQKWYTLMFSAKESIYKCILPLYKNRIGFYDAEITPATDESCFAIKLNKKISSKLPATLSLSGRYLLHEGDVFTSVVLM